jgi:hypothetical protein
VSPGINPEIFMSPEEVMRAPPLSVGALATTVAVPSAPAVIVAIEGAAGGPRGRCQVFVICVLGLHLVRKRIRSALVLLLHVFIEIVFEPGVPFGTAPI